MIYGRLRNIFTMMHSENFEQVNAGRSQKKGNRKRNMQLIVGTKATGVSRDRSQGSYLSNKEEPKQRMLMMPTVKGLLRKMSLQEIRRSRQRQETKPRENVITEIKIKTGENLKNMINRSNTIERSRKMRTNKKCLLDLAKRNSGCWPQ